MLPKYILINALIIVCPMVSLAQTADDYFHMASQSYINGNYKESKQIVNEGLTKYPSDSKLNALKSKIKEPPPQDQKNKNQQQQNQQQQKQQQQPRPQPQKGQMSKQQADQILQALQNKEKENMKKQKDRQPQKENAGKDW
jgi:type IV secretory pathway VirB10-like protein